ncbi:hypothetical protein SDJN03_13621, partial [Cucurbita argyrosperma subsp. sororia]
MSFRFKLFSLLQNDIEPADWDNHTEAISNQQCTIDPARPYKIQPSSSRALFSASDLVKLARSPSLSLSRSPSSLHPHLFLYFSDGPPRHFGGADRRFVSLPSISYCQSTILLYRLLLNELFRVLIFFVLVDSLILPQGRCPRRFVAPQFEVSSTVPIVSCLIAID